MNVETMRFVDFWFGVPICFLFSCFNSIFKITGFTAKGKRVPRKILFIKLSELGAIILAYPLLKRIKGQYPFSELFFVTSAKNESVFTLLYDTIPNRNIFTIREDNFLLFVSDSLRVIIKLRREKIDIAFDLDFFSRFTAILSYLIQSEKRIGFHPYTFEGLYRGNFLTHKVQYNPLSHISKNYLAMGMVSKEASKKTPELNEKVDEGEFTFPKYKSKSEVKERMYEKLKGFGIEGERRLFLLNPGEGILPLREWPLDNFIILTERILEENKNYIVIIGTGKAAEKGDVLLRAINNSRCISLIGQTTIEELAELFGMSDVLISNDCGLAHLAMLSSIKKFIIFGPESPQVFGPLGENNYIIYSNWPCSPCLSVFNHRKSACKDNKCLKNIKPCDVYELISQILEAKCPDFFKNSLLGIP